MLISYKVYETSLLIENSQQLSPSRQRDGGHPLGEGLNRQREKYK